MPTSLDPQPGANEIECARCGAIFSLELTRCPQCGVNLYEPEEPEPQRPGTFHPHPQGVAARLADFLRRLAGQPHPAEELFNQSLQQAGLFNDLLRKTGGDRAAVERLIDFERQQRPNGTRIQWLERAVKRWEQDNQ
jgi:hypothetical protein